MSFPCPHCGGEIVVTPGSSPFPGWRNPPDATGRNPVPQYPTQGSLPRGRFKGGDIVDDSMPKGTSSVSWLDDLPRVTAEQKREALRVASRVRVHDWQERGEL